VLFPSVILLIASTLLNNSFTTFFGSLSYVYVGMDLSQHF